jgi:hypothetical protein
MSVPFRNQRISARREVGIRPLLSCCHSRRRSQLSLWDNRAAWLGAYFGNFIWLRKLWEIIWLNQGWLWLRGWFYWYYWISYGLNA